MYMRKIIDDEKFRLYCALRREKEKFIKSLDIMRHCEWVVGCAKYEKDSDLRCRESIDEMGFNVLEHVGVTYTNDYYTVYDKQTNVIYFFSFLYTGGISICPRYDENGNVMIYEGD